MWSVVSTPGVAPLSSLPNFKFDSRSEGVDFACSSGGNYRSDGLDFGEMGPDRLDLSNAGGLKVSTAGEVSAEVD